MATVRDFFLQHVSARPDDPCWMSKAGDGSWRTFTFVQAHHMVTRTAVALAAQGLGQGSRVVIWANTCMEWVIVDLACWMIGAVSVPIYYNTTAEQAVPILGNCGAQLILAENTAAATDAVRAWGHSIPVMDLRSSIGQWIAVPTGREFQPVPLSKDALASIVYTSGTTGEPKGVELTHGNFAAEVIALQKRFDLPKNYVTLGFLPLSHIVARAVQCFQLTVGFTMAFAESIEKVADNLKEVRPDFFVSVPRIFEKVYAKVVAEVACMPRLVQHLFNWGRRTSLRSVKKFIFRKIFAELGGKLRFTISGGAPLNSEVAQFFNSIGLPIYEGYGLTETTAAACVNFLGHNHYGTVGRPVAGVTIRFDADGEILLKGPIVTRGYHDNPDANRAAFTEDGFFRSGDIGELTPDGYLKIADRKKDLIVTAGGKKIAPQVIEQSLMQSPYVAQVFVYGDRRPYITALIVPNHATISQLAAKMGLKVGDWGTMVQHPEIRAIFQKLVDKVNSGLAQYETIKHFHLVPREFSQQQDELTPTLKVRRKVIQDHFASELNSLYA